MNLMTFDTDSLYVFDLDGVITNPENSQVNEMVVSKMCDLLAAGVYLAINTGRSYDWVDKHLMVRLSRHLDNNLFAHLLIVCEKGGESVVWKNGRPSVLPSRFSLNQKVYTVTRQLFLQNKRLFPTMFWDEGKRTMASIEKLPLADLNEFHTQQDILIKLLADNLLEYDFRVDATTIATDIESTFAGKYSGAEIIWEWSRSLTDEVFNRFISIGDSLSDFDTARCFADKGAVSTFVYVGELEDKLPKLNSVRLVITDDLYDAGTLEFLIE